jgi:hypothetical protein
MEAQATMPAHPSATELVSTGEVSAATAEVDVTATVSMATAVTAAMSTTMAAASRKCSAGQRGNGNRHDKLRHGREHSHPPVPRISRKTRNARWNQMFRAEARPPARSSRD